MTSFEPGQFTGEASLLSGRRGLASHPRGRGGRGVRDRSRGAPVGDPDRQRPERDLDARLHPAARRADRAARRRRGGDRLDPLRGNAAHQGVPQPKRPSLQLRRSRRGPREPGDDRSARRRRRRRPGGRLPRSGAQESDQPADRGVPRLQRVDRSDPGARSGGGGRGPRRARRGGLRIVRGARRPGARDHRARRPGRVELEDRELPRFSDRDQRRGAGGPRLLASAEVRRSGDHRQEGEEARLCACAVRDRDRRRHAGHGQDRDPRHRRAVPEDRGREPVAVRRGGRLLRGVADGGGALPRPEGHRGRRRELGGAGGGVPRRLRAAPLRAVPR